MSEFDKEAERRRLREKYESEEEDRETTERMSQLLLQGATMTNQHCDACGSPIFRYQGQEFCPTCQAEAQEAAQAGETPVQQEQPDQAQATSGEGATDQPTTQSANPPSEPTHIPGGSQAPTPHQETTPTVTSTGSADLSDAGEALASTIATLAARAAQTDDPRRAKEFLEAANEAADALATLSQ